MACECDECKYGDEVSKHLDNLSKEDRIFFNDLYGKYIHESDDCGYYKAIVTGTWPDADEIIAHQRELRNAPTNKD